jgi:hypothetical protein
MNVNVYFIEDYENETAFMPKKTKPKQTQFPKGQNRLPENLATPIIGVQPQIPCYVRDGLYTDYLVLLVAIHSCKVNWRQE